MSKKHQKVYRVLNYIEHLLILVSIVTGCISNFDFASLVSIPIAVTSPAVGLKICVITSGIKKHKSVLKETRKHNKILLLAKSKLNGIEGLTSKALIDSYISYDEFVLKKNVLKETYDMKEKIRNSNDTKNYI